MTFVKNDALTPNPELKKKAIEKETRLKRRVFGLLLVWSRFSEIGVGELANYN